MPTLLIIDDDPNSQNLLKARLEKSGYTVQVAADGPEGLRLVEKKPPDLIFLDIRLPKMDGWQVCRTLKGNPLTSRSAIIMLTGCSQDAQELYGKQCGADAYVTKPWDAKELLKTTARVLEQANASRDAKSDTTQKRIKEYVQRIIRLAAGIPKEPHLQEMSGSLMRLGTGFLRSYETALEAPSAAVSGPLFMLSAKQLLELRYWLELLRDSKASGPADIPLLIAESTVLHDVLMTATPPTSAP